MSYNPNNTNNKDTDIVTPEDGIVNGAFTPKNSFYTLYNTKLQNIFTDYAASKAQIAKAEEESLQDAYYIKEMSKKYLGEYASNTGLGDVSGNLMDIHSTYAGQRQAIGEKRTEAELQLDSAYRSGLSQLEDLRYEYEEGVKGEKAQKVLSWLQMGDYGTRADGTKITDPKEYLDKELAEGNIDQEQYNDFLRISQYMEHQNDVATFQENLEMGYYGKKLDEEGNEVYQSRLDYITEAYEKGLLTKKEYDRLYGVYQWMDEIQNAQDFDIKDFTSPYLPDGTKNPDFISGLDVSYYTNNKNIDKNSLVMNIEGIDFISEKNTVDKGGNVTSSELNDVYEEENPDGVLKHGNLLHYRGEYYVYKQGEDGKQGEWYRMSPEIKTGKKNFEDAIDRTDMTKWVSNKDLDWLEDYKTSFDDGNVKIDMGHTVASMTINGIRYMVLSAGRRKKVTDASVKDKFKEVHGDRQNAIIYHNGKLYYKNGYGNIFEMVKMTT